MSNQLDSDSPDLPRTVTVGRVGPLTIPCPTGWGRPLFQKGGRTKRVATEQYCSNWRNPQVLGGTGHSVGWGILSTISLGGSGGAMAASNRNYLVCGLTILGNATTEGIDEINLGLEEVRTFAELNRYALDYILAREGGVCAIVKGTCIMGVTSRFHNISKASNKIKTLIEGMGDGPSGGDWGFGGWYDWIINILIYLAIIVCCIFVGIAVLKCILARMMRAVGSIGDSVTGIQTTQKMMIQQMATEKNPLMEDEQEEEIEDVEDWLIMEKKKEDLQREYERIAKTDVSE